MNFRRYNLGFIHKTHDQEIELTNFTQQPRFKSKKTGGVATLHHSARFFAGKD